MLQNIIYSTVWYNNTIMTMYGIKSLTKVDIPETKDGQNTFVSVFQEQNINYL